MCSLGEAEQGAVAAAVEAEASAAAVEAAKVANAAAAAVSLFLEDKRPEGRLPSEENVRGHRQTEQEARGLSVGPRMGTYSPCNRYPERRRHCIPSRGRRRRSRRRRHGSTCYHTLRPT